MPGAIFVVVVAILPLNVDARSNGTVVYSSRHTTLIFLYIHLHLNLHTHIYIRNAVGAVMGVVVTVVV